MSNKKIGILTGGGDCPGLNPAIKAATLKALEEGFDVVGIRAGYKGLMDRSLMPIPLDACSVSAIDRLGGTILNTSRTNPFRTAEGIDAVVSTMDDYGLNALIAIGGEDTLGVAHRLHQERNVNIVAIPKTIDNDLSGTEYCLGFQSAVQVITDCVDNLRPTAESHSRVFVVEVMGRHAGHLALAGAISTGALMTLLPEHPFDLGQVANLVTQHKKHQPSCIFLVAEGAMPTGQQLSLISSQKDAFGHLRLGGIGQQLAESIEQQTGYETRAVVLSHLQRGGVPTAYDRMMGFRFGIAAIEAIMLGKFGYMAALKEGRVGVIPIAEAVKTLRVVDLASGYDVQNLRPLTKILCS